MTVQLDLFTGEFEITSTGLSIDQQSDYESWRDYGQSLNALQEVMPFAIGDWIADGHRFKQYEHGFWDTVQETYPNIGLSNLQQYEWVAKSIKSLLRNKDLSWSHHYAIAPIDNESKQQYWLEQALINKWSVATLRQKISESTHVTLIKDDMLTALPTLGKFNLVVTDPPYGVTKHEWDKYEPEKWLKAITPHLADEYNLFWFCSPHFSASLDFLFKAHDIPIQSRIIWHRRNMAMGSKSVKRFVNSWEMIIHAGNRDLNFPDEWSDAWFDVQTFAVPQTNFNDKKLHPTQKPEALIQRLVDFGSYPGDKILDPFAGSGTAAVVTPDDREITLIEKEEGYVGIIEGRLGIKRA